MGLPKATVEGAQSIVEETKEMAAKAGEKISTAVSSSPSPNKGMAPETSSTGKSTAAPAPSPAQQNAQSSVQNSQKADKPANQAQPGSHGQGQKSAMDSAGIAGLPQGAIDGAKSMIEESKELAGKVAKSVTE